MAKFFMVGSFCLCGFVFFKLQTKQNNRSYLYLFVLPRYNLELVNESSRA
ncbi:MAG: hypothetical protein ACI90V_001562 [Bacillariaceae sp.]|jgi:hypothetical protein